MCVQVFLSECLPPALPEQRTYPAELEIERRAKGENGKGGWRQRGEDGKRRREQRMKLNCRHYYKRCLVVYTLCAIASFPDGSKVIRGIMRGRESLGARLLC